MTKARTQGQGLGQKLFYIGGVMMLSGVILTSVFVPNTLAETAQTSVDIIVNIHDAVSVSASSNQVIIDTYPDTFGSGSTIVTASTNNRYGYNLTMNAITDDTALNHSAEAVTAKIPSITSMLTPEHFPTAGGWGYALDATNYSIIPPLSSPATLDRTVIATTKDYTVTFGAKPSRESIAGSYINTVVFSVTANVHTENRTLADISTMQEIDPDICANTAVATATSGTYTLMDARDNKNYTVARLKDGNCWMTQNLALGSNGSLTITPDNSDVYEDYTLPTPGKWFASGSTTTIVDTDTEGIIYDETHPEYGVYYNWTAATAGTGNSSVISHNAMAPASVCPKGWRLPYSDGTTTTNNEFYALFKQQLTTAESYSGNWENVDSSELLGPPLSMVFSGSYFPWNSGYFSAQGNTAEYWSRAVNDMRMAFNTMVYNSINRINAIGATSRIGGSSVRCVAKQF